MLFRSHRNRRLPDRAVEAGTAGRGLRHVAIWLADRGGGGRLAGAVRRAADRLDAGLYRLCAACPFRHARVAGDGRTRTASRATPKRGMAELVDAFVSPLKDFFTREGAPVLLLFVLVHKNGEPMANLMIRDLLGGLGFTKDGDQVGVGLGG